MKPPYWLYMENSRELSLLQRLVTTKLMMVDPSHPDYELLKVLNNKLSVL